MPIVTMTPIAMVRPVVAAVVAPVTGVVTSPVVDAVIFLVATSAVGAATPGVRALQWGHDRGSDDGSQNPLHGIHRFTPAR